MSGQTRAIEVFTALGGIVVLALIAVAIYVGENVKDHDPGPWFLATALVGIATVAVPGVYFGLHPLIVSLDKRRTRILNTERPTTTRRTGPTGPTGPSLPSVPSVTTEGILLRHAWWGSGSNWAVVTDRVAEHITNGQLAMAPTNNVLGVDPTPNVGKYLIIEFERGGVVDRRTIAENTPFILP